MSHSKACQYQFQGLPYAFFPPRETRIVAHHWELLKSHKYDEIGLAQYANLVKVTTEERIMGKLRIEDGFPEK